MRGKVTDQDLTNYALNELSPDERLYVESMLAISEECRHDVYQMLELGEMMKEGFEQDEAGAELLLNEVQRSRVLEVPRFHWRGFVQRAAAIALLAAGTAYTMTRPGILGRQGTADQLAVTSEAVGNLVAEVRDNGFARTAEEVTARLLKASVSGESASDFQFVAAPAVCTPPIFDLPALPVVAEM